MFLQSGFLHHMTDVYIGMGHEQLASITFFTFQPLGIAVESLVQAATRALPIPPLARKSIGYAWVLFFLWWSTAILFYPAARLGWVGEMSPYSLIPSSFDSRNSQ